MKAYCALLVGFLCLPAFSQVVTVDMDRVFTEYIRTRQAEQQLQEQIQRFREDQQELQQQYQGLVQEFNQLRENSAGMELPEEQRRAMAQRAAEALNSIRALEEQLRASEQTRQQQIEEQGRRLRQRLIDEITGKIREMAATRNWALVVDAAAVSPNGVPMVLFTAPATDITVEVIQALNHPPAP